jgi:RND family efflux transporter MFP subunit
MIDYLQGVSPKTRISIAVVIVLCLLLVWMEGGFEHKARPGNQANPMDTRAAGQRLATVERRETEDVMNWPGEVTALTLTHVAPKYPGRILDITVRSGTSIKRGQLLVKLDDSAMQAKLGQSRAALASAEAEAGRAHADAKRMRNLFEREAATHQDYDAAMAASRGGEARVNQARESVHEAEASEGEMLLKAPFDGFVVERKQEPGDMALPGTPILTVQQSQQLRIEAAVPGSCSSLITVGNTLSVRIANPPLELSAIVDEIEPAADTKTRTVLIKARLPSNPGLQPGAYGWLEQSCRHESVLLIPTDAVSRIGQLECVHIVMDGKARLRHIRTGKKFGESIEVLSGLNEGDVIERQGDH